MTQAVRYTAKEPEPPRNYPQLGKFYSQVFEKSSTLNLTGGCADLDHFGEPFCAESDIFPDLSALNLTCILIRGYKTLPIGRGCMRARPLRKGNEQKFLDQPARSPNLSDSAQGRMCSREHGAHDARLGQRLPVLMLCVCAESDRFGLNDGVRSA